MTDKIYNYEKQYVNVQVLNREDGALIPLIIYLGENQYIVDIVLEMKRASSIHVTGVAIRYKIKIQDKDKETYLYFEDNQYKWFIERKIKQ